MSKKPHADSSQAKGHKHEDAAKPGPLPERTSNAASDFSKIGPLSVEGVEASDLPDKGRGSVDTAISKEMARKLPQQIGGALGDGSDVGLRGTPDIADADEHGGQGRNLGK